jgi:hypothetical protein
MAGYSFRIRFDPAPTRRISAKVHELCLPGDAGKPPLKLASRAPAVSLEDSDRISLVGAGYDTLEAAIEAGRRFNDALTIALARLHFGADFGDRTGRAVLTDEGLKRVEAEQGSRMLRNVHGLTAYQSEPTPRFVSMDADIRFGTAPEKVTATFLDAVARAPTLSERERVASTLFNGSFFQDTIDSRFMLLVMAIEVMLEPAPRPQLALDHAQKLIDLTQSSALADNEKQSMISSLQWLKKESIGQAGRKLARERLGARRYNDKSAEAFFSHAYAIRSNLAHGNMPLPTIAEVGETAAGLVQFVSDLLTVKYLP